jgi:hypothetical protein
MLYCSSHLLIATQSKLRHECYWMVSEFFDELALSWHHSEKGQPPYSIGKIALSLTSVMHAA